MQEDLPPIFAQPDQRLTHQDQIDPKHQSVFGEDLV